MEIRQGEYCEGYAWEIELDEIFTYVDENAVCKHALRLPDVERLRSDSSVFTHNQFKVPRVVTAYNEGHQNRTSVCLDCILEQAQPGEQR